MSVLAQEAATVGNLAGEIVAATSVGAVGILVFRTLWRQSQEWERIASDRKAEIAAVRSEMARKEQVYEARIAALEVEVAECKAQLSEAIDQLRQEST